MANTIFQIIDLILLLVVLASGIYIFVFSMAALGGQKQRFPTTKKKCRIAILIPDNNLPFKRQNYPIDKYKVFYYTNLIETITLLNENEYDNVVILGETTYVSENFLNDISDAIYCNAQAIQLHHITDGNLSRRLHHKAVNEEVRNAVLKWGHNRMGLSSAFDGIDVVLDTHWLKDNLKSEKANLENRLLHQGIYIYYLPYISVHSPEPRPQPQKFPKKKALSNLFPIFMEGNFQYLGKLIRCFFPSWQSILFLTFGWSVIHTFVDWRGSLLWWGILLIFLLTICADIPDYLVKDKKKNTKKAKQ